MKKKNPWDDIPIEVIIEHERQEERKRRQYEESRPRIYVPAPLEHPREKAETDEQWDIEYSL